MSISSMKTLVLTGGSSGIGRATCVLFAERGWQVFELSRHGQSEPHITHIYCDVCNKESVDEAIAQVLSQTNHIDVLIANAGFGISGAVEFTALDDAKKQFDVNFFGAVSIVQAVLPQMRNQHAGRIIFTSSVAAVLSIPYQSFYSACKAAINTLALALQNEVRTFGIRVSVLMPGDVSTGFTAAREKSDAGAAVYPHIHSAVSAMEKDERTGMPPKAMAKDFYRIATCRCPRPQYTGGALYKCFVVLNWLLPKRLVNYIIGKMYA